MYHIIYLLIYTWSNDIGTQWHAIGKYKDNKDTIVSFDYVADKVWRTGAEKRQKEKNLPTLEEPNYETFVKHEYEEGVKYFKPDSIFPNFGFENTYYYRKKIFAEMVTNQISDYQLKSLKGPISLPRYMYSPHDCDIDMDLHYNWRKTSKYPLGKMDQPIKNMWEQRDHEVNRDVKNLPAMCMEYAEYVANLPVRLNDLDHFPGINNIVRNRN